MKSCMKKRALFEIFSGVAITGCLLLLASGCASTAKQEEVIEEVTDITKTEVEPNAALEEKRLQAEREKAEAKRRLEAENRRMEQERKRLEEERLRAEEARRRAEEEQRMMAERNVVPQTSRETGEETGNLGDIRFEYDKADITSRAAEKLQANAEWLMQNPGVKILVEGHCDERGTAQYNISLGERRALAVKKYLMSLGISGERISTISYGEEMPLDLGHDEAAMAKNRRAHFLETSS
ncbi:MAG: peptidoglycan-associated lipoprotein Pal [Nitrospinota bacterium]